MAEAASELMRIYTCNAVDEAGQRLTARMDWHCHGRRGIRTLTIKGGYASYLHTLR